MFAGDPPPPPTRLILHGSTTAQLNAGYALCRRLTETIMSVGGRVIVSRRGGTTPSVSVPGGLDKERPDGLERHRCC